jgi:hypothetical protein
MSSRTASFSSAHADQPAAATLSMTVTNHMVRPRCPGVFGDAYTPRPRPPETSSTSQCSHQAREPISRPCSTHR